MLHFQDWRRIAPVWREFAPRVYEQYPSLLAEMYAYCMAAAHLEMPHARVNHLMLSNVAVGDEGWALVDGVPLEATCPARHGEMPALLRSPGGRHLPAFLHFCQNYRIADWIFAKRRVPPALFETCDHPLLASPPASVHELRYELHPPGNPCREEAQRKPLVERHVNRTGLAICLATYHTNAAADYARERLCVPVAAPAPVKLFDLAMRCDKPQPKKTSRRR